MSSPRAAAARPRGRLRGTLVAEVMHAGVVTCPPHVSLAVAARIMAAHRIHAVVVATPASNAAPAAVWGVVSDVDVLEALAEDSLYERSAGDTAAAPPLLVTPVDSLEHAVRLMREHRATHLVVVDPVVGRPVGVLSTLDVAETVARDA